MGSPGTTDDEISILSDYDSMEELITESSQFIKDKPIQQFMRDIYKFKLERIYNEKGPAKTTVTFLPQVDVGKDAKENITKNHNVKRKINATSYQFFNSLPIDIQKAIPNDSERMKVDPFWQYDFNKKSEKTEKKFYSSKRKKRLEYQRN